VKDSSLPPLVRVDGVPGPEQVGHRRQVTHDDRRERCADLVYI
jgi:hypothetical protein